MGKKKHHINAINVQLSSGAWLKMRPVSIWMVQDVEQAVTDEWIEKHGSLPTPPTYTITTAAGDVETHEYDRKAAESEEDEAKRAEALTALDKYEADQRSLRRAQVERKIDLAVYESAEVVDVGAMEAWEKRVARYGVKAPSDLSERKALYIKRALLTRAEDWTAIVQAMTDAVTVSKEKLAEAEAAFRSDMERDGAAGSDEAVAAQPVAGGDGVDPDPADGGEGVGQEPERVLQPEP